MATTSTVLLNNTVQAVRFQSQTFQPSDQEITGSSLNPATSSIEAVSKLTYYFGSCMCSSTDVNKSEVASSGNYCMRIHITSKR